MTVAEEISSVMNKPNLLYVFADQMRSSTMGFLGQERVHTPNLDRLASQGVVFENATANVPVCTPSRASLLTGRHALTCRCLFNDMRLPEEEQSLADVLKPHGYRTGYVGKWHLDGISRHMFTPRGRRRHGFDDYWAAYNCNHRYFEPRFYLDDCPEIQFGEGYDADVQTDQAIQFLNRFRDEPFCLFLSWGPPHSPYRQVPREFLDIYPPEEIALHPNVRGGDRAAIAGYYAHMTALDRNIGRLLHALERLDLADDTILVFSSDHGDMLWAHGLIGKEHPYEESVHIPLLVRWPDGLPAGERTDTLISVVDYAPTLLGLMDIPVPAWMNGLDLSPTILDASNDEPSSAFIAQYLYEDQPPPSQPWRGVRTKRYTYARWLQGGEVLFDNREDPYQLHNLALDPEHKSLADRLEQELQDWLERLDDRFLPGEEHICQLGQWEEWQIRTEHFTGVRAVASRPAW